jgi:7,8-dihydro-6-hydroxymethylpterin dimethyltransferase
MMGIEATMSLCPVCLKRIPAGLEREDANVYLVKDCPDHGHYRTLIWEGTPAFNGWKRPKIPTTPPLPYRPIERGCPFDCGLCPDHRQRSCTIILEVTGSCNLACAFCYAGSGTKAYKDPDLSVIRKWYRSAFDAGGNCHIQISGGEPTLRDDLPEIVRMGRECGFSFIQINTNGLRLASDNGFTGALKSAGLDSVFLQFDALNPKSYQRIRGRNLLDEKMAAIEACGRHGLGVVLVPTLVPGVNTHEIGALIKRGLALAPVVRAIHFQPVSYFGRFPEIPADENRITLPRLMRAIEDQTGGLLRTSDFKPPGCENALCSFHANYLIMEGGDLRLLGGGAPCCKTEPEPAEEGAARTVSRVARQWSAPPEPDPRIPKERGIPAGSGQLLSLDDFLLQARRNTFSVSAMAFQDVWSLDLERLRDCCIHIMTPDGELVPFCAYNLTSVDGRSLYR